MKKLFETKLDNGFWRTLVEHEVFEYRGFFSKQLLVFDAKGNEIKYEQPGNNDLEDYEEDIFWDIEDATKVEPIGENMYIYSTHPVRHEPGDGYIGILGIKDYSGNIIVEEQYEQIDYFFNGLCSVKKIGGLYGCIDKTGKEVISFSYHDFLHFNKYGVAIGNHCLIDISETPIPDTKLNLLSSYYEDDRYIVVNWADEEQEKQIEKTGYGDGIKESFYDTKNRCYVVRDIPENTLSIDVNDCPPDVVIAAAELLKEYEEVSIRDRGLIVAKKEDVKALFDYL